ncbi:MAG: helix-turn-helix domain-containing protein [Patescibacteria group bacterium]|mgnify:CR=1 FL=1
MAEGKYLTIKQAAVMLGVSPLTLRNWDKKGQLVAYRHPVNNYRVYKRDELNRLLERIEEDPRKAKKLTINLVDDSE